MENDMSNGSAPLFAVQTSYDEQVYQALVGLMMDHLRRWPRMLLLATGLLTVAGSGFAMIATGDISLLALLFLFLGNIFAMLGLFAKRLTVRLMMAGNPNGEKPVHTYTFYEDQLIVATGISETEYSYGAMRRVLDYKGHLLFFLSDGQAFLMRHTDVSDMRFEALRGFLNARLAERKAG